MVLACHECGQPGHQVGTDTKGRAVFICRTTTCDVVEYDADLIRLRSGPSVGPSEHPRHWPSRKTKNVRATLPGR